MKYQPLLLFLFLSLALTAENSSFLVLSDIHFSPFINSEITEELLKEPSEKWEMVFQQYNSAGLPKNGEVCNYQLLKSTLKAAKLRCPNPDFILFNGDILAHKFNSTFNILVKNKTDHQNRQFIYKTFTFVFEQIRKTFPAKNIYFTLGNNDSYSGDYDIEDDGAFLKESGTYFSKKALLSKDFQVQYSKHGYYSIEMLEVPECRLISLNSIFFSTRYRNKLDYDPGKLQLKWLEKELQDARNKRKKVWLLTHIPPGVDVFKTLKIKGEGSLKQAALQWQTSYNDYFCQLIKEYSDVVLASFSGHTHMDDFRLFSNSVSENGGAFMKIVPAITPVFGNNPAFLVMEFNKNSARITDYSSYNLSLDSTKSWRKLYSFNKAYKKDMSSSSLQQIFNSMGHNANYRQYYQSYYSSGRKSSLIAQNWYYYALAVLNLRASDYIQSNQPVLSP